MKLFFVFAAAMLMNMGLPMTGMSEGRALADGELDSVLLGVHINGVFRNLSPGSTIEIKEGDELNVLLRAGSNKVRVTAVWSHVDVGLKPARNEKGDPHDHREWHNYYIKEAGVGYSDVTYNILDPRVSRRAAVGHFRVVSSAKGPKVDLAEARRRIRLVVDDIDEAYTQAAFEFQNDRFGSRVVADLQRAQFDASQIESDVTQGDILNLDQDAYNLHLQINEIADRADQLGASFRLQRLFVRIGDDINFLRELVQ